MSRCVHNVLTLPAISPRASSESENKVAGVYLEAMRMDGRTRHLYNMGPSQSINQSIRAQGEANEEERKEEGEEE